MPTPKPTTVFYVPVTRITLTFASSHRDTFDLPTNGSHLSNTTKRIVDLLAATETPLTRKQVATMLGYSNAKGHFGQALRRLVAKGTVFTSGGKITNDVKKFDRTT